jgi:23S rRNA (cytosine1962-C5)-methyltransferase
VTFVDASAQALELCKENARLNGLRGGDFVRADCFDFLKEEKASHEVIVLDPPSFIKSKKKLKEGEKGYIALHKKALRHLGPEGHLFTFSCSYHMRRSRFRDMVRIAAYGNADLYLVRELYQAGDHPVLLTIPETEYLKGLIVRVRRRGSTQAGREQAGRKLDLHKQVDYKSEKESE